MKENVILQLQLKHVVIIGLLFSNYWSAFGQFQVKLTSRNFQSIQNTYLSETLWNASLYIAVGCVLKRYTELQLSFKFHLNYLLLLTVLSKDSKAKQAVVFINKTTFLLVWAINSFNNIRIFEVLKVLSVFVKHQGFYAQIEISLKRLQ